MIVTRASNNVKRIPSKTKLEIGLQAISRKQPIVDIAQRYDCSRTTVYKQQEKIIQAANKAYECENNEILFYIPVTKKFIEQIVVGLFLICKSSYRDIMFFLKDIIHYDHRLAVFLISLMHLLIKLNYSINLMTLARSPLVLLMKWFTVTSP